MNLKEKDINKYIKNRIMNSKDIFNVIKRLEKEGYKISYGKTLVNEYNLVHIEKNNTHITVCYENIEHDNFKQLIRYVLY